MGKRKGKPRLYGEKDGQICRPITVSMPVELIDRLRSAADQIGVNPSIVTTAAVRAILSQSTDRLQDAVAARGKRPASKES
jgi:hypothetical protein